jgi:hypothetical protein
MLVGEASYYMCIELQSYVEEAFDCRSHRAVKRQAPVSHVEYYNTIFKVFENHHAGSGCLVGFNGALPIFVK